MIEALKLGWIARLGQHADYLTDENFHEESRIICDVIQVIRELDSGKNDALMTIEKIVQQLEKVGP